MKVTKLNVIIEPGDKVHLSTNEKTVTLNSEAGVFVTLGVNHLRKALDLHDKVHGTTLGRAKTNDLIALTGKATELIKSIQPLDPSLPARFAILYSGQVLTRGLWANAVRAVRNAVERDVVVSVDQLLRLFPGLSSWGAVQVIEYVRTEKAPDGWSGVDLEVFPGPVYKLGSWISPYDEGEGDDQPSSKIDEESWITYLKANPLKKPSPEKKNKTVDEMIADRVEELDSVPYPPCTLRKPSTRYDNIENICHHHKLDTMEVVCAVEVCPFGIGFWNRMGVNVETLVKNSEEPPMRHIKLKLTPLGEAMQKLWNGEKPADEPDVDLMAQMAEKVAPLDGDRRNVDDIIAVARVEESNLSSPICTYHQSDGRCVYEEYNRDHGHKPCEYEKSYPRDQMIKVGLCWKDNLKKNEG